jgi:phospholipase D1/2
MLKAAAERGVRINIVVYKEVEAALTLNSKVSRTSVLSVLGLDRYNRPILRDFP